MHGMAEVSHVWTPVVDEGKLKNVFEVRRKQLTRLAQCERRDGLSL